MATVYDKDGKVILVDEKCPQEEILSARKYWDTDMVLTYERAVELSQSIWPIGATAYRNIDKLTDAEKELLVEEIKLNIKDCKDDIKRCQVEIKSSNETDKSLFGECNIKSCSMTKGYRQDKRKEIVRLKERIDSYTKYLGRLFDMKYGKVVKE